ncbi:MAG: YfhO family protein [Lachnospiraceae bacterium]|nr:YfhO family protein [Lachnospiraceae bacterium]
MLKFWNSFKNKKYAYTVCYTAAFIMLAAVVLFRFPLYNKTIIWQQDGLKQHYNAILYYGKYLKQIFNTLITEHRLELPMWDHSIGYGSDIITTLHYYAIGDPLAALVGLVPEKYCQYFFSALYLLRLYLAGLAFSAFSFYHGNKRFGTMIGSFIYIFSAYSLVLGLMHPFFVAPLIWFPLILLGIDKIFNSERPYLFIVFTSIAAMSNFYFFYMEIVLALMYAVYRYFNVYKKFSIKTFAATLAKFMLYGLNAFLISAVILLPVLNVMFSSARFQASEPASVPLFYHLDFYLKVIAHFTTAVNAGSWTMLGYTAVGLFSVIFAFVRWKKNKSIVLAFVVLTLFLLIPAGGYALNGFSYVVNRWTWCYAMLVGFITARMIPQIITLVETEKRSISWVIIVMAVITGFFSATRTEQTMGAAGIILAVAMVMMVVNVYKCSKTAIYGFVALVLVVGLASNAYYKMSVVDEDSNWINEFKDVDEADKLLKEENSDSLLASLGDNSFYRIEESGLGTTQNSSIQRGTKGTQFYFSLTSPYISEFIDDMYMNWPKDYDYEGVESRSVLESLASVKYFLTGEDSEASLPYNFSTLITEGDTDQGHVKVWENNNSLPVGYTYSKYVKKSDFDEMSVTEREQAMLSGAVVEESELPEAEVTDDSINILKSVETRGDVDVNENSYVVRKNGRVVLNVKPEKDSDMYVVFKNLKFKGMSERETYNDGAWAQLTEYQKNLVKEEDAYGHESVTTSLSVTAGDDSKIVEVYSPGADYYCGRSNFMVNFGSNDSETVELSFRNAGTYTFDSVEVLSVPHAGTSEKLSELSEDTLENVVFGTNTMIGTISLDEPKLLALSIPYSEGWTACVDGNETEIKRTNVMYMGLELGKGDHVITLSYRTPYLKAGAYCTFAGIIMLLGIIVINIVNRGRHAEEI